MRRRAEMLRQRRSWAVVLACVVGSYCFVASQAAASDKAESASVPLIELVPDTAGLCIELERPVSHLRDWFQSETWKRWCRFPPIAQWLSTNGPGLIDLAGQVQRHLGMPFGELLDRLCDGRLIVAVWPPGESNGPGEGLVLLEAADADVLTLVRDSLVEAQRRDGRLQGTLELVRDEQTFTAYRIAAPNRTEPLYLCTTGRLAILCDNQRRLDEVLDQLTGQTRYASVGTLPEYKAAQQLPSADAPLRLFVNPRQWDAAVASLPPPPHLELSHERQFPRVWQSVGFIAAGVRLMPQIRADLTVRFTDEPLAAPLEDLISTVGGSSSLAQQLPAGSMIAAAGRVDLAQFANHLVDAGLPGVRKPEDVAAGILLATVVSGLGPEMSFFVQPRQTNDGTSLLPLELVARSETQSFHPNSPPAAQQLAPLVQRALDLGVDYYNRRFSSALNVEHQAASDSHQRQTTITLPLPLGQLTPTLQADDRWIWFASSQSALGRTGAAPQGGLLVESTAYRATIDPRWPAPGQLVVADLAEIRRWMKEHRHVLDLLAQTKGLDPETAERSGKQLFALLSLADTIVAQARFQRDGISFHAALATHADAAPSPK